VRWEHRLENFLGMLPSMKASSKWNRLRSRRSSATASKTPRMTPERTHC
jgi:hypothetical protein